MVSFKWLNTVFEILSFCRINLQFGIFSYALLRFSLLHEPPAEAEESKRRQAGQD